MIDFALGFGIAAALFVALAWWKPEWLHAKVDEAGSAVDETVNKE